MSGAARKSWKPALPFSGWHQIAAKSLNLRAISLVGKSVPCPPKADIVETDFNHPEAASSRA
jgi:hypothetical protein